MAIDGRQAERVSRAIERLGPSVTPALLEQFAKATREMLRNEDGAYRRRLVRVVAQRVEIRSRNALNISGCRVELIRTLATSNGSEAAALVVPGRAPEWRALLDTQENYAFSFELEPFYRADKGQKRGPRRSGS